MTGESQLTAMLADASDRHYHRLAAVNGDHETDYERFGEAVEWLAGDLSARGVHTGQRIGLCISGGWEYLLTLHALVRLDVVVVPIDPCDGRSHRAASGLELHFFISHCGTDAILEEMAGAIGGGRCGATFEIAEEFTLVAVSPNAPLADGGGVIVTGCGHEFWPSSEIADRVRRMRHDLALDDIVRTTIPGPWTCSSAVLLVLACAASGSCIQLMPVDDLVLSRSVAC